MSRFDLSPLMRHSVGFDHLNRLLDNAFQGETSAQSYPPYNIEKLGEDDYLITLAVAGFKPEELDVTVEDMTLTLSGRAAEKTDEEGKAFLHRGIATRAFERRFQLADNVEVGAAGYENGLLTVELRRVIPEHKKPRSIEIKAGAKTVKTIQSDAA